MTNSLKHELETANGILSMDAAHSRTLLWLQGGKASIDFF